MKKPPMNRFRLFVAMGFLSIVVVVALALWWSQANRPPRHSVTAELSDIHLQSLTRPTTSFPPIPPAPWTLVNFWAPWCAPCRKELPLLDHLARHSNPTPGLHLEVVGIALDSTRAVSRFMAQHPLHYPVFVVAHHDRAFVARFHLTLVGLPVTLLLNRRNQVVATHVGILNPKSLRSLLATR